MGWTDLLNKEQESEQGHTESREGGSCCLPPREPHPIPHPTPVPEMQEGVQKVISLVPNT